MSDVPDDIQQKAEAIKEACHDRVVRWEGSPDTFTALVDDIADALMAERAAHMIDEPIPDDIMKMAIEVLIADATVKERERCAKIADAFAASSTMTDTAAKIAAAIRRGTS